MSELVGNSLGIEMVNFDDLTNIVNDLRTSLQTVADSIAAAVSGYNAEHGTSYIEESAREALGQ